MAIARRAVGAEAGWAVSNPTLIPGIPAGTAAGDVMVLFGYDRSSSAAIANPTGWTEIFNDNAGGGAPRVYLGVKVAGASESSPNVVVSGGAAGAPANAIIVSYTGVDTADPIDVLGGYVLGSAGSGAAITGIAPSHTASAVLVFGFEQDDWTSVDTLTGDSLTWAEVFETDTELGNDCGIVLGEALDYVSGSISNKTFTFNPAPAANGGYMLSLNAAPVERAAAVSAVGSVAVQGQRALQRQAAVAGAGSIAAVGQRALLRSSGLSASAAISAAGVRELLRAATLDASGGIATAPQRALQRQAALDALAAIASDGSAVLERAAVLTAVAQMAVAGEFWTTFERSAALAAVAPISTAGLRVHQRQTALAAVASIAAVGTAGGVHERSASLAALATVSAVGQRTLMRAAALSAVAEITNAGSVNAGSAPWFRSRINMEPLELRRARPS